MASMDRNTVHDKVVSIIAEQCGVDAGSISEDATLDTIGADSLDRVEIVITLEETFNVEIGDEAADQITTVGGYIDYIMEHAQS